MRAACSELEALTSVDELTSLAALSARTALTSPTEQTSINALNLVGWLNARIFPDIETTGEVPTSQNSKKNNPRRKRMWGV